MQFKGLFAIIDIVKQFTVAITGPLLKGIGSVSGGLLGATAT